MFYVNRSSPDHCFLKAKLAACIAFAAMVVGSLAVSPQVYSAEKPTAGKPKAWDQLVEKARREGMVVLYGPGGLGRGQPPVVEAKKASWARSYRFPKLRIYWAEIEIGLPWVSFRSPVSTTR